MGQAGTSDSVSCVIGPFEEHNISGGVIGGALPICATTAEESVLPIFFANVSIQCLGKNGLVRAIVVAISGWILLRKPRFSQISRDKHGDPVEKCRQRYSRDCRNECLFPKGSKGAVDSSRGLVAAGGGIVAIEEHVLEHANPKPEGKTSRQNLKGGGKQDECLPDLFDTNDPGRNENALVACPHPTRILIVATKAFVKKFFLLFVHFESIVVLPEFEKGADCGLHQNCNDHCPVSEEWLFASVSTLHTQMKF